MTDERSMPRPPADNAILWRYLTESKFDRLLRTFSEQHLWESRCDGPPPTKVYCQPSDHGSLWFALPDAFADSQEGTFPVLNESPEDYCRMMAIAKGLSDEEAADRLRRFLSADTESLRCAVKTMARLCGVSCWHENDRESQQMWEDYVGCDDGVAIRTTCQRLETAVATAHGSVAAQAKPSVCAVGYVDFDTFFLPQDGYRSLLALKGEGFRHENEIRMVAKSPWFAAIPLDVRKAIPVNPAEWEGSVGRFHNEEKENSIKKIAQECKLALHEIRAKASKGFTLPVDLKTLCAGVVLKPDASDEYRQAVMTRLEAKGIDISNVEKSAL